MWEMLSSVDAAHGLYYFLMHAWFAMVPVTEFWARVPSAVLIGVAAAGVVVLGRLLSSRYVAVAAGVAFAVLPRTTWAAVEARSYALTMAIAVWLTVLCVIATRRNQPWLWLAYSASLAAATVANLFLLLMVCAHVAVVAATANSKRAKAAAGFAAMLGVALAAPFLLLVRSQLTAFNWIWPIGPATIGQALGDQYFPAVYSSRHQAQDPDQTQLTPEMIDATVRSWALVAPVLLVVVILGVVAVRNRRNAQFVAGSRPRVLVAVSAAWIVGPTTAMVIYSLVQTPVYVPRYLSFTTPAVGLLIGLAAAVAGVHARRIAAIIAILVVASVPNYLAQRSAYAKFGMDYSQVADLVETASSPGDCLVIDDSVEETKQLKSARPDAYPQLRDIGQDKDGAELRTWSESRLPASAWAPRVTTCPRVWMITHRDAATVGEVSNIVRSHGFRVEQRWEFNLHQVARLKR